MQLLYLCKTADYKTKRLSTQHSSITTISMTTVNYLLEFGTLCLKKRPTFTTCYNFYIHSSIATIFGTSVAEKVSNQNLLYFLTTFN